VSGQDAYRAAGVNIDAGNEVAKRYGAVASKTKRPGVLGSIGGFAGGFELDLQKYPQPVLLSGTDGVGTKLKVAFANRKHDSIGIDCVAMCVNDILTMGAEPLFFLDYLAVGTLDVDIAAAIVAGIADGCEQAGCALVGGETAEMPDMYAGGEYDVAGFCVGVVNKDKMIDGQRVQVGDAIVGIASHGAHSNGFSLIRKLLRTAGVEWSDELPGWRGTVGDELLQPTRIYVKSILSLLETSIDVRAMAHITGGGIVDNIPRSLPSNMSARIHQGAWPVQSVFEWLQVQSQLSFEDAARVWNMGIGYVVVVPADDVDETIQHLQSCGESAYTIGYVIAGKQEVEWTR